MDKKNPNITIQNYFDSDRKPCFLDCIRRCDWGAAGFLAKLLEENRFFEMLGGSGALYLLLADGAFAGFVTLTHQDCIRDEGLFPWLGFLYITPEYRGHRYGRLLLEHAMDEARRQGCPQVYLATDHVGLYEKYGFSYLENRVDVWGDDSRIYYRLLSTEKNGDSETKDIGIGN